MVGTLAAWRAGDGQQVERLEGYLYLIPEEQGYGINIDTIYHAMAWRYASGWCWKSANKLATARNKPQSPNHFYINAMLALEVLFDRNTKNEKEGNRTGQKYWTEAPVGQRGLIVEVRLSDGKLGGPLS